MELFINDRNGATFYFKQLTFKQTLELQKKAVGIKGTDGDAVKQLEIALELFKSIFELSNPEYDMANYDEDIEEYNYQILGMENFVSLINVVVEKVFLQKETNMPNPYPFLEKTNA